MNQVGFDRSPFTYMEETGMFTKRAGMMLYVDIYEVRLALINLLTMVRVRRVAQQSN